jgi:NADH-quinone oxidoreductase subunit J
VLFQQILFFVAGAGAIAGAFGVVTLRNPFFSVLSLVAHLISLSVLFLLLTAAFLAAAQVVVYAGAVMVLYVFVVSYVGGSDTPLKSDESGFVGLFAPIFGGLLFFELAIAVVGSGLNQLDTKGAHVSAGFGSPGAIGELLLTRFLLPFEIASFLLVLAAVGAVVLARKRDDLEEPEADNTIAVSDLMKSDAGNMPEAL